MRRAAAVALAVAAAALLPPGGAAAALRLERVGSFAQPVYVTGPPGAGGRLFVGERRGRVRIVRGGRKLRLPFLDIHREVLIRSRYETVDQRGLLSIAFAPDYRTSRRLYVFFVDRRDRIRVDELRRSRSDPDRADKTSRRTLFTVPGAGRVHHGGQLAFGRDGALYASVGFTNEEDAPQDPASLRGKIVRIDVDAPDPRPEVWATGLRNPYRFSFDRKGGALTLADVGQNEFDEIDYGAKGGRGANFGWSVFEANARFREGSAPGHVKPVIDRTFTLEETAAAVRYIETEHARAKVVITVS